MTDTATNLNNLVQGLVMLALGVIMFLMRNEAYARALKSSAAFWNVDYIGKKSGTKVGRILTKIIVYSISFVFVVGGSSFVWTACRNLMR